MKATSTISAITSSSTKPELQVLPPLFLVGGEKVQGLEHLGGKPRVTPAECTGHLTSPTSFLHLQNGENVYSIIVEVGIQKTMHLKALLSLQHGTNVNCHHYYSGDIVTVDEVMSGTRSEKRN